MTQYEFICRYRWRPGTLGFWDNRATMHYGIYDYGAERRVMHRVTLRGERPQGSWCRSRPDMSDRANLDYVAICRLQAAYADAVTRRGVAGSRPAVPPRRDRGGRHRHGRAPRVRRRRRHRRLHLGCDRAVRVLRARHPQRPRRARPKADPPAPSRCSCGRARSRASCARSARADTGPMRSASTTTTSGSSTVIGATPAGDTNPSRTGRSEVFPFPEVAGFE